MAAGKLRAVVGAATSDNQSESSALFARFERGELSVEEYLDARASEAVAPYEGKLPAGRLAWLKGMLREQLETDPVLAERVRQATERVRQAR
jgi:hypothetical protein